MASSNDACAMRSTAIAAAMPPSILIDGTLAHPDVGGLELTRLEPDETSRRAGRLPAGPLNQEPPNDHPP